MSRELIAIYECPLTPDMLSDSCKDFCNRMIELNLDIEVGSGETYERLVLRVIACLTESLIYIAKRMLAPGYLCRSYR